MTSKAAILSSQPDLKDLSWEELEAFLAALGAERYRARQVSHRLFKIGVTHVSEMTDLPKSLRQALEENARISRLSGLEVSQASDGTRKLRFQLEDGAAVESVLMHEPTRVTLCLSTQAG
jgi:23S rRNA (adenine2503-C2)-methyltransferase